MNHWVRWVPPALVLLLVASISIIGCSGDKGIITEAPGQSGGQVSQSTCVGCHTNQNQIEATTDYVPPAEGSSGEG